MSGTRSPLWRNDILVRDRCNFITGQMTTSPRGILPSLGLLALPLVLCCLKDPSSFPSSPFLSSVRDPLRHMQPEFPPAPGPA